MRRALATVTLAVLVGLQGLAPLATAAASAAGRPAQPAVAKPAAALTAAPQPARPLARRPLVNVAQAVAPSHRLASRRAAQINVSPCPLEWKCAEIGQSSPGGSQSVADGAWTVTEAGTGFAGYSDRLHLVGQALRGDGQVTARLVSQSNLTSCAIAGLMFRANNRDDAPTYTVEAQQNDCNNNGESFGTTSNWKQAGAQGNLLAVQYRPNSGSYIATVAELTTMLATYLRITRIGDTFTAYTSSDGSNWVEIDGSSETLPEMGSTALAGMAVAIWQAGETNTAVFDHVSVGPPAAPGPALSVNCGVSPTAFAPALGGSTVISADVPDAANDPQLTMSATLLDSSNQVVATLPPSQGQSTTSWQWAGTSGDGEIVSPERYGLVITAVDGQGVQGDCTKTVLVLPDSLAVQVNADPSTVQPLAVPASSVTYDVDPLRGDAGWATATLAVTTTVHDAETGAVVRTLAAHAASGDDTLSFDGLDDHGQALPAAAYTIAVDASAVAADTTLTGTATTPITVTALPAGYIPWHPHEQVTLSAGLALSVDLSDGHVDVTASGMSIPALGQDLAVASTWDSIRATHGFATSAGAGWTNDLTPSMTGHRDNLVTYTDAGGAEWLFHAVGGSGTAHDPYTYTTPPGLPYELTATTDGYTLQNILTDATARFDAQGRLLSQADSYGHTNSLPQPLPDDGPASYVNSGARALALTMKGGLLAAVQSPLWQNTSGAQGQQVGYDYLPNGQLQTLTYGDGTKVTFGYDGDLLNSITTPNNQKWELHYDDLGALQYLISPPQAAPTAQTQDTPAYTTYFAFGLDDKGRSTMQVWHGMLTGDQNGPQFDRAGLRETLYTLDEQGQAVAVQNDVQPARLYTYDGDHDILSAQDANGNKTRYSYFYVGGHGAGVSKGSEPANPAQTVGLLQQVVAPPITSGLPNATHPAGTTSAVTTKYDYDASDNLKQVIQANGGETDYTYNDHHQVLTTHQEVIAQINACGQARQSTSMVKPADCIVKPATWRDTTLAYDASGNLHQLVDGRGNTWTYDYTMSGDLQQSTTPAAQVSSPTHAPTLSSPILTTYQPDADGQATQVNTTPEGRQLTQRYDHRGRLVETVLPVVAVVGPQQAPSTTIVYDADGRVSKQTDALGHTTTDWYDPLGRLLEEDAPGAGRMAVHHFNATALTESVQPGGSESQPTVTTRYIYDDSGRLQEVTDSWRDVTYEHDPNGNATKITQFGAGQPGTVTTQSFDGENKVSDQSITLQPTVDQTIVSTETVHLAYDQLGNPTDRQPSSAQGPGAVTHQAYDLVGEPIATLLSPTGSSDQLEQTTYDDNGNAVTFTDFGGNPRSTVYDAANRPTQVSNGPVGTGQLMSSLGIGADGQLTSRNLTGQTDYAGAPFRTRQTITS